MHFKLRKCLSEIDESPIKLSISKFEFPKVPLQKK